MPLYLQYSKGACGREPLQGLHCWCYPKSNQLRDDTVLLPGSFQRLLHRLGGGA